MARELFVYWKVGCQHAAAAHAAALGLMQTVRTRHPEIEARLMRRADEGGEMATFMETYSAPPPGVTPAVQAAIEAHAALALSALGALSALSALSAQGAPARHVEVFESLDA